MQPSKVVPATTQQQGAEQNTSQPSSSQRPYHKTYEPSARTNAANLSPAAEELVSKAKRYSAAGDSASALRYLERAQRISPRAPQVYLAMAEVRQQQGEIRHARQLANKALSLVGDNSDLKQAAESLLREL